MQTLYNVSCALVVALRASCLTVLCQIHGNGILLSLCFPFSAAQCVTVGGPFKMGPMGWLETLVRNYHYSLCNYPKDCSSHLLHGGSLKSHKLCLVYSRCPFLDCSLPFALIALPVALPDHSLHLPAISVGGLPMFLLPSFLLATLQY
jgi:hypothetical protein